MRMMTMPLPVTVQSLLSGWKGLSSWKGGASNLHETVTHCPCYCQPSGPGGPGDGEPHRVRVLKDPAQHPYCLGLPEKGGFQHACRRDLHPLANLGGKDDHVHCVARRAQAKCAGKARQALVSPHGKERPPSLTDGHVPVQMVQLFLALRLVHHRAEPVGVHVLGEGPAKILDPRALFVIRCIALIKQDCLDAPLWAEHALYDAHAVPRMPWHRGLEQTGLMSSFINPN